VVEGKRPGHVVTARQCNNEVVSRRGEGKTPAGWWATDDPELACLTWKLKTSNPIEVGAGFGSES